MWPIAEALTGVEHPLSTPGPAYPCKRAYTYDSAGRLATRTWARQVSSQALVTTYSYDANTGELTGIDYSDATPAVAFTYTRTGQKHTVTDVAGTRTFAYTTELGEDSESIDGGLYTKLITRKHDSLGRSGGFQIGTSGDHDANYDVTYSYDSTGRFSELETAVPSSFTATYGYVTNSNLVGTVTFPNSITATKSYEADRDLLAAIENKVGTTTISKYEYPTNDAAGRRTAAAWSGSAFTQGDTIGYGYNSRSEVTGATATNRTAYDFDYSYDNIGNRATYAVQGQTPPTEYVPNSLNQYTVTATPTEAFFYDDDGNLIEDGTWHYEWDAENRLAAIVFPEGVRYVYTYDYMGRRVARKTYAWMYGNWQLAYDYRYVYDGWNLVLDGQVFGQETVYLRTYTWGLDLSGTMQGAGGVGGLLGMYDLPGAATFATVFDGNGNVSELLRTSNGAIGAHYEYDPFGGTTAATGSTFNWIRFSTKYFEPDGPQLYYYGLRSYSPRLGRWISRDPIGEQGGPNVLAFVGNLPVEGIDAHGEILAELAVIILGAAVVYEVAEVINMMREGEKLAESTNEARCLLFEQTTDPELLRNAQDAVLSSTAQLHQFGVKQLYTTYVVEPLGIAAAEGIGASIGIVRASVRVANGNCVQDVAVTLKVSNSTMDELGYIRVPNEKTGLGYYWRRKPYAELPSPQRVNEILRNEIRRIVQKPDCGPCCTAVKGN